MALSDPLFNPTELRKLAQDNGPEYAGRARRALRWCADVLEAADVVVQESRGDDALIRKLVEALEAGLKEVIATSESEGVLFGPDQHVDAKLQEAITAARARLAPPPSANSRRIPNEPDSENH